MCVIIVKPAGIDLPNEDILSQCMHNNDDGFGLAWADGRSVHIRKGAMTLEQVFELIARLPRDIKDKHMIMHFRLGTQGAVMAGNCHPYPISSSINRLHATTLDCQCAVAHNGHIYSNSSNSWYYNGSDYGYAYPNTYVSRDKTRDKLTDTAEFIRDYLAGLSSKYLKNSNVLKLIDMATDSKFALLFPTETYIIGEFSEHKTGLLFSNLYWEYTVKKTPVVEGNIVPPSNVNIQSSKAEPEQADVMGVPIAKDEWMCESCDLPQLSGFGGGYYYMGFRLCWDCYCEMAGMNDIEVPVSDRS
jgi:hypothetical protein